MFTGLKIGIDCVQQVGTTHSGGKCGIYDKAERGGGVYMKSQVYVVMRQEHLFNLAI